MNAVLLVACLLGAMPAVADCNTTLLTLASWSVAAEEGGRVRIETQLTYNGEKPLRMLDAIVNIEDVLGEYIATIGPDRDIHLVPGQTFADEGSYDAKFFGRLLTASKADIVLAVCIRGVVYDDGTVEKF